MRAIHARSGGIRVYPLAEIFLFCLLAVLAEASADVTAIARCVLIASMVTIA